MTPPTTTSTDNAKENEQKMEAMHDALHTALNLARDLNREGEPTRSRELSLVITKLEEADHWHHSAKTVS